MLPAVALRRRLKVCNRSLPNSRAPCGRMRLVRRPSFVVQVGQKRIRGGMRRAVVEGGLGMRAGCRPVAEGLVRQGEIVMYRRRITSRAEGGAKVGDGFVVAAGAEPECAAID